MAIKCYLDYFGISQLLNLVGAITQQCSQYVIRVLTQSWRRTELVRLSRLYRVAHGLILASNRMFHIHYHIPEQDLRIG